VQLRAPLSGHVLELIAVRAVPPAQRDHGPTRPGAAHVAFAVPDLDRALAAVRPLVEEAVVPGAASIARAIRLAAE